MPKFKKYDLLVGNALPVFPHCYFLSYSCPSYFPGNTFNSSRNNRRIFFLAWDVKPLCVLSTVSPASLAALFLVLNGVED
jgi:hypothetical protein